MVARKPVAKYPGNFLGLCDFIYPMTYSFTDELQVEEYIPTEDDWASYYEDDQELEAYSLECAFGPEE